VVYAILSLGKWLLRGVTLTKKIIPATAYISAQQAALILSEKSGRPVSPQNVCRLKGVRFIKVNDKCKMYLQQDIEAYPIRKREQTNE
jgi:hypothetical protein